MKLAVGIDIGGTITKIGLVSEDGKCMVVASKDLGVYVSLDYGENWNQKYNQLSNTTIFK